jgi:glycosyltransferase involved in cell wall biosynthesis
LNSIRSQSGMSAYEGAGARVPSIGIFHPTDPVGHIPGGIESVIRGILKFAPADLKYTLFGATSDLTARPLGRSVPMPFAGENVGFVPIVSADASAVRGKMPLTLRYLFSLRRLFGTEQIQQLSALDFHRVEPLALFTKDRRPKNVMIHQDMSVIRDKDCDIGWRHAPWLYEWTESALLPRADRVYCVRQSAVDRYRKLYPAIADSFTFLPTWVDTDVFRPALSTVERQELRDRFAATTGISPSARLLVSVGRLDRQKDPLLLLDAFERALARRPDCHLVLIGDGNLRREVEARCQSSVLVGKVSLLGARRQTEIADWLRLSDLFVLSSAYEGMPIVVLEALACGLPVVTTNVGEVQLTVRTGINGMVVNERSPAALAEAILATLADLQSLRGAPCVQAVTEYVPERVLSRVYDNHRRQAACVEPKRPAVAVASNVP